MLSRPTVTTYLVHGRIQHRKRKMQYRRSFTPGGSFFFTVVTAKRRKLFDDEDNVAVLREAFRKVKL